MNCIGNYDSSSRECQICSRMNDGVYERCQRSSSSERSSYDREENYSAIQSFLAQEDQF